jgi:hypothetical protein
MIMVVVVVVVVVVVNLPHDCCRLVSSGACS